MDRYKFEHEIMPAMFFEDCSGMVKAIEQGGGDYVMSLYKDNLGQVESPEDYDGSMLDYEGGVDVCRIFVPRPEEPGQCVIIYLILSREYEALRFVTVEASKNGGYEMNAMDKEGRLRSYGNYDGRSEQGAIDNIVKDILIGEGDQDGGRYGEMCRILDTFKLPYYEDEVLDYIKMFKVIGELIGDVMELSQMAAAFASLKDVVLGEEFETSHDKIKREYQLLEELPASKGKLDHKGKLFFAFSVYAACMVISENDDKKHHFFGIAEFESADAIKYKMEEYWSMDPYMFKVE